MVVGYGSFGVASRHTAGYLATEYKKCLLHLSRYFKAVNLLHCTNYFNMFAVI
jgi:hypothetical protein